MKKTNKIKNFGKFDVLTLTDVFVNQKRMNVCEHTVKMASHNRFK